MSQYAALIKMLAILGAALFVCVGCFSIGAKLERLKFIVEKNNAMEAMADSLRAEQAKALELTNHIRTLLDRPAAKDTIRTVIRENPSNCVRPAAVTDGLQVEIASANKAIAASRGRDTVP